MKNLHYDSLIIGFGKGGKTLAGRLAKEGEKVALAEKDSTMYGGTCINVGCIPSKSLINSASKVKCMAGREKQSVLYSKAVKEKRRVVEMLRKKNFDKLNQLENVDIYNGTAVFSGVRQADIQTEDEIYRITADKIFINTGSTPRIPNIEGIENTKGIYTSAEIMDLDVFPERLVIIGGGYIGLEFASMFASFGSKVTVLQDGEKFLPKEDDDVAQEIKSILEAQGIEFCTGLKIERVYEENNRPSVSFKLGGEDKVINADAVLVATGRIPNTENLNCAAAGVNVTDRGVVETDSMLRTTAENIWALGDVKGGLQHTYVSLDDYRIVASQLFGEKVYNASQRKNVPYSVFLSTPYSRVGMNEREAISAGYNIKVKKLPAAAIPKAQVLNGTEGMLKAVIDADNGKILGAMLICSESFETINVVKLAIDMGADYTVLRDQIFTHPTMTEALNDLFDF